MIFGPLIIMRQFDGLEAKGAGLTPTTRQMFASGPGCCVTMVLVIRNPSMIRTESFRSIKLCLCINHYYFHIILPHHHKLLCIW